MLAAVILAAGGSSRMGQPKQLLKFRGTSLLRRAIDTALAVPTDQVIVVLGHAADQLIPECEATGATVVLNDQWREGVSTSLRGGLAAVVSEARGVFIYPADMPLVTPEALRELAHRQQVSGRPAAMTEAGGVRGVPVFITRSLFPSLMIQEGDVGGAQYLRAHPEAVEAVHFADPDIVRDVDRPEDYARLLELDPDAELA
ncbi:MAG: nucleotidyltransferase family protein [Chloroflexi bacterium]|nr:nucleotidyltransferase family protein [Chloroflexota bacterium]